MKVIVFGASQGLGRQTTLAALAAGHDVTAFARHPERLGFQHDNLKLATGDVLEAASVAAAVVGHDAVVITLGQPTKQAMGLPPRRPVLSRGTANIIGAMENLGVRRLICETAIGAGESRRDCSPLLWLAMRVGLGYLFRQKDEQERLTKASQLEWTIIRPTALTNGPGRDEYIQQERLRAGLFTHVSRADVASAMVGVLGDAGTYGKALTVSYPPRLGDSLRWIRHYR